MVVCQSRQPAKDKANCLKPQIVKVPRIFLTFQQITLLWAVFNAAYAVFAIFIVAVFPAVGVAALVVLSVLLLIGLYCWTGESETQLVGFWVGPMALGLTVAAYINQL